MRYLAAGLIRTEDGFKVVAPCGEEFDLSGAIETQQLHTETCEECQ